MAFRLLRAYIAGDSFECQFFASEEDARAWLNHSGGCQSLYPR